MDNPFHTKGLRHGANDPRGLLERIEAQLAERIEEAVEMSALELLVELSKRHQRAALARAETSGGGERDRALRGQVFLAKQLPDYWQRFEGHRAAHATARLSAPLPPPGLLKRLFGS